VLKVQLGSKQKPLQRLLCLGAHCDDIEIGCGGTILRLIQENPDIEIDWIVFSSNPKRKKEAVKAAKLFLQGARKSHIVIKTFKDGFFPYNGAAIKKYFESLKKKIVPDLILTHFRNDLHQDHRLICDLTWNTFRGNFILEYEIPKYDGDLDSPNFYVGVNDALFKKKTEYILNSFLSQCNKHWFTHDTFAGLARIRGVEANCPERYAEGFYCRKFLY
jgi:LmbE family N-acetylglucosaminyl deacetylase